MDTKLTLKDLYGFPGFRALAKLTPHPEDPDARVATLRRRQKKVPAPVVVGVNPVFMTVKFTASGTWRVAERECISNSSIAGFFAAIARP
jgi:hypothetical protein